MPIKNHNAIPWTCFMDMHSGGGSKESPFEYIYIQAPEREAELIFYNRFGHSPNRVTCTCCGEDYSVTESKDLEQATGYMRGCKYQDGEYVEEVDDGKYSHRKYITLDEYLKQSNILLINDGDIKDSERVGDVPRQGYVWQD